jgi:MurNAc alpha-1-phosphate uridylyltransferase
MKAMILAAGRGERLKPLTDHTPKPMLPVAGKPLIAHQLGWLRAAGITEVVINLHHLGEQIQAFCGDGEQFGVSIRYSHEETLLETAGGIVNALPLLGSAPFVLLNGDIFTDFAFASLPDTPPSWADLHIVLTPTPAYRDHGDFEWRDGRITRRGDDYVYCGIAVINPDWLAPLAAQPASLQQPLFDAVANGRVSAQVWNGEWTDIGTPAQLKAINARLSEP